VAPRRNFDGAETCVGSEDPGAAPVDASPPARVIGVIQYEISGAGCGELERDAVEPLLDHVRGGCRGQVRRSRLINAFEHRTLKQL
jgi:hypothetical protein